VFEYAEESVEDGLLLHEAMQRAVFEQELMSLRDRRDQWTFEGLPIDPSDDIGFFESGPQVSMEVCGRTKVMDFKESAAILFIGRISCQQSIQGRKN
jgi:hypothetical protein